MEVNVQLMCDKLMESHRSLSDSGCSPPAFSEVAAVTISVRTGEAANASEQQMRMRTQPCTTMDGCAQSVLKCDSRAIAAVPAGGGSIGGRRHLVSRCPLSADSCCTFI